MLNIIPNCHPHTFILGIFATRPYRIGSLYPKLKNIGVKHTIDIKKIAFTKLRKLEVLTFFDGIVRVINRHDTKVM